MASGENIWTEDVFRGNATFNLKDFEVESCIQRKYNFQPNISLKSLAFLEDYICTKPPGLFECLNRVHHFILVAFSPFDKKRNISCLNNDFE